MDVDALRASIDTAAGASGFAGAVRVDVGGATLHRAYGAADRRTGRPNAPTTRFAVASGSKAFTALLVVRLIEDGCLAYDTPARQLLGSDLPLIADDVTVEHLLAHRSGIGDYLDEDEIDDLAAFVPPVPVDRLDVTEAFLPWLDGHPTAFPAGTRFAYCNGGYVVLALLAERAAGRPFHDLVDELVLRPAGLADTAYLRTDELPADTALGYLYPDDPARGTDRSATNDHILPVRGNGDGGAYTTVDDVYAFWQSLFAGRIVSRASVGRMTRRHSDVVDDGDTGPARGYGLGFWIDPPGHFVLLGGDAGVSFKSIHCPERALTVTVVSNWTDGAWPITGLLNRTFGT